MSLAHKKNRRLYIEDEILLYEVADFHALTDPKVEDKIETLMIQTFSSRKDDSKCQALAKNADATNSQ